VIEPFDIQSVEQDLFIRTSKPHRPLHVSELTHLT